MLYLALLFFIVAMAGFNIEILGDAPILMRVGVLGFFGVTGVICIAGIIKPF
jgi:hypothetical protein